MSKLLSIIVPCHNVDGKFTIIDGLSEIRSSEVEIIFINDSSTDGTSDQIKASLEKLHVDARMIEGSFGGPGAARNAGMAETCGKYIWMVDADDLAKPGPIIDMLDILLERDFDFVAFRFVRFDPKFPDAKERITIDPQLSGNSLYEKMGGLWIYNMVINRDFLARHKLKFLDNVYMYEDYYFIVQILHLSTEFQVVGHVNYEYLYRTDSLSHATIKPRYLSKWVAAVAILEFVREHYPSEFSDFDELFGRMGLKEDWAKYVSSGQYAELVQIMPYLIAIHRQNGLEHHFKPFLQVGSMKNRAIKRLVFSISSLRTRLKDYGMQQLKQLYT